jgi:type VI secretion system secreted protein Hcp
MALNAYLKLKGQKQGEIKGSSTQRGRENAIVVIATHHEISSPRDTNSGLPTGKRLHKPLVITKELDQSTPLLYTALVTNENLIEWELQFWRSVAGPAGAGQEEQDYTITLSNASIASIESVQPNNRNPELAKLAEYENIAFTYQKIQWTWVKGGITAVDSWTAPAG